MPDQAIVSPAGVDGAATVPDPRTPVDDELDVADLPVRGSLPEGLVGVYLRTGPNPQFPPLGRVVWPFDGDGMIHAVGFTGARVHYRNRWVLTRGLAAERESGRARFAGIHPDTASDHGLPQEERGVGLWKNVANANILRAHGRTLALAEGGLPYELSPSLGTVGELDFDGRLPGGMTAHPKIDPIWEELVWFRYDRVPPYLVVGTLGPDGSVRRVVEVDVPDPVLMHDFAVTDRHVVLFDSPAVLDPSAGARGAPLVQWREARGTRVGVLSREASRDETVWIPVENMFALHVLNAFSSGDSVIVDYVHRRALELAPRGAGSPENVPRLHRMIIDPEGRTARDELLDDRPCELPRIDERRSGLPHRYGYVAALGHGGLDAGGAMFDTLVQHDLEQGDAKQHRFVAGTVVGEPTFVPDPMRAGELGGWVLAFTYDTTSGASELVVIDAADFAAAPVAVVGLPRRVPAGTHGCWLPA